ncbi:hypothetical protein OH460_09050 [Vibrio sp. Makdt]|uniref:hypothetical protein n=1 Tax=Vibrio sp. Makdt TaxID=2998828 RepID=UPI0022CD710F|nr:hypothetical protein [Vibrio sp. Makdt]MDA0152449.1 hypothetical protein [Vibrio sp. Makdt]
MASQDQRSNDDQQLEVVADISSTPMEITKFKTKGKHKKVVSTIFDVCFIPCKLDVALEELKPDDIAQIANYQKPWAETIIEKPYWAERSKYWANGEVQYTKLKLGVFGAIPTTDDRHILDTCIALGHPIDATFASRSDLRDILWSWESKEAERYNRESESELRDSIYRSTHLPECIPYENLSLKAKRDLDNNTMFNSNYQYVVVSINELAEILGKKSSLGFKSRFFKTLTKLSAVRFNLTPAMGDYFDQRRSMDINLINQDFFTFCDTTKINNKKNYNSETSTHVLLGISQQYHSSLLKDSTTPRDKILEKYIGVKNIGHRIDFVKFLEANSLGFFNGYLLNTVIDKYLESKIILGLHSDSATKSKRRTSIRNALLKKGTDDISHNLREITGYVILTEGNDIKLRYIPLSKASNILEVNLNE